MRSSAIIVAHKSCLLICFGLIISVASVGTFSAYAVPSSPSPSTFFAGSSPYGVPYNNWMEKWWQWNMQIPKEQHPLANPNLTTCPVGESGSVSFLTQSLQGESRYSCTIPSEHAIMIPISTGECTTDEAKSSVPADMAKCATEGNKYLTYVASVDGVRLNGLDQNNAVSNVFNLTVPKDNFGDLKPGTWQDVTGGYFAFIKPLPVGNHTLDIAGRVTNPVDPSYNFNYHTVFLLKVQ